MIKRVYEDSEFDVNNVVVSATLTDNDFGRILSVFMDMLADQMATLSPSSLSTEQKTEYFTKMWELSCPALYQLNNVRAFQVAKWDDDLYAPNDPKQLEKTIEYLTRKFDIRFDDAAQKKFYEIKSSGNGEYIFVDSSARLAIS